MASFKAEFYLEAANIIHQYFNWYFINGVKCYGSFLLFISCNRTRIVFAGELHLIAADM